MMLKRIIVLFLLLFGWNYHQHAAAQDTSSTVQLSPNDETCNVVNLHIGATPTHPNEPPNRMVGAPGKIGPIGPIGGKGSKGEKGGKGSKGEEGRTVEITEVLTKVNNMHGVSNCTQLSDEFGITESGYYLMRSSDPRDGLHVYCDFTVHEGLSNCEAIRQRVAMPSGVGHYLVRVGRRSAPREIICSKVPIPSTCDDLLRAGETTSGKYTMEANSHETFEVYCNFANGKAITEIWHDEMGEIQNPTDSRCRPQGCYSWSPRYKISPEQILGIITKSSECRQFIKSRCVNTQHLQTDHAWWVSRDGEKMTYWGGATSRRDKYCACGETETCINNSYKCNCDSNDANTGTDEGYLTDKTKLPVRELRFGDLNSNSEFVWHTLGKLECWGQA